ATQDGTPLRASRRHEQYREFIDGQRHQRLGNLDALELRSPHTNVGDRLTAHLALVGQLDIGTHQLEDIDHTGARRVDAHVFQGDVRAFGDAGGDHEEGG